MARREDARLLAGRAAYVGDLAEAGDLWLRVVRSDVPSGRVLGLDLDRARAADGVRAVLSGADLADVPTIPIRIAALPGIEERRQPVIATDEVRYVGEPLAVVVADDPYRAEDAAGLVTADIAPNGDAVGDVLGGWRAGQPHPREAWRERIAHGDARAASADAAETVRERFEIQRQTALPIETRGLRAAWDDPAAGPLRVWGVTKFIHFTRRALAEWFGLPPGDVRCHRVDVGGMFGVRGELYPEDFLVAWAARVVGRPVSWSEDRREHMLAINHSREQHHDFELSVDDAGRFLAFRDEAVLDAGAYARPIGGRMVINVLESLPGPYRWRAYEGACGAATSNKTPVGTVRAPCTFEATLVREHAIDLAAARLGVSPAELRRRNLITADEMPYTQPMGGSVHDVTYDSGDFAAVLEGVLEHAGYERLREETARRREAGQPAGVGIACYLFHSGIGSDESVELDLGEDGRFRLGTSGTEFGQGLATMLTTVVCDALGTAPDDLDVDSGSSEAHAGGRGSFASRSAIFLGSAARDACLRLQAAARERAAERWGVAPARVTPRSDGMSLGSEHLHWKELAPLRALGSHHMGEPTYGFGTALAVVSVDPTTAGVEVERLVVGYDCGRVIDRAGAVGQIRGGAIQGLSNTLLEHIAYTADGLPRTTTLADYPLATARCAPDVEALLFETAPAPGNPLGAKGVGEAGTVGVGGALANALADALGTGGQGLGRLPLTPARLARWLR